MYVRGWREVINTFADMKPGLILRISDVRITFIIFSCIKLSLT